MFGEFSEFYKKQAVEELKDRYMGSKSNSDDAIFYGALLEYIKDLEDTVDYLEDIVAFHENSF